jgi:hypothetical protein
VVLGDPVQVVVDRPVLRQHRVGQEGVLAVHRLQPGVADGGRLLPAPVHLQGDGHRRDGLVLPAAVGEADEAVERVRRLLDDEVPDTPDEGVPPLAEAQGGSLLMKLEHLPHLGVGRLLDHRDAQAAAVEGGTEVRRQVGVAEPLPVGAPPAQGQFAVHEPPQGGEPL